MKISACVIIPGFHKLGHILKNLIRQDVLSTKSQTLYTLDDSKKIFNLKKGE